LAARTPREAVATFTEPLQRALSCITVGVLIGHGHRPSHRPYTLTFPGAKPAPIIGGQGFQIDVSISYTVDVDDGIPSVRLTRSTCTLLLGNTDVLGYHWHPEDRGEIEYPHLHIYGRTEPVSLRKAHLPTGLVPLQEVVRLLIAPEGLGVTPARDDWEAILGEPWSGSPGLPAGM
jgi:hypothetical protein